MTLLLDPAQALRLLLAEQAGSTFRLLLRAPGDTTATDLPPAQLANGAADAELAERFGASLASEGLLITSARFRQTSVPAGGVLEFEATVRNVSSQLIPAGGGGAGPGHAYAAGESWETVGDPTRAGVYGVALTSENAEPLSYPWRWDLGQDLAPGQSTTVTGGVQVPNLPGVHRWWFGIVIQPGTVVEDGVAPVEITIEPVSSVVVMAPEIDLRESPWPNAASVLTAARGTRAEVLDYRDGWFLVRSGQSDGWVPEGSVANAVLPEAAAAAESIRSNTEASQ